MRTVFRNLLIISQYVVTVLAVFVGVGMASTIGALFSLVSVLALVVFAIGTWLLVRASASLLRRRTGYRLMILACLPTVPVSLFLGVIAARQLAVAHGVLRRDPEVPSVARTPSAVAAHDTHARTEPATQVYAYYTRRLFGSLGFFIGLCALAIGVLVIVNGHTAKGGQVLSSALIVLFFSAPNRKPRITIHDGVVVVRPNAVGAARSIPFSDIADVRGGKEPITFILKDQTKIIFPKLEFSRTTRAAVVADLRTLRAHA